MIWFQHNYYIDFYSVSISISLIQICPGDTLVAKGHAGKPGLRRVIIF